MIEMYHLSSGEIIATSVKVTTKGGEVRKSPQNPLNLGLGIQVTCPDKFQQLPQISPEISSTFPSSHFPKMPMGAMGALSQQIPQDQSGKMSMEEFNWAYATLQQEVEEPMAINAPGGLNTLELGGSRWQ